MDNKDTDQLRTHHPALIWTGRVISVLIVALFAMSATMKLMGGEELKKGTEQFGLPDSMVVPLAVVELSCAAIYLFPPTAMLGAILLTGYLGGAICTHWRVGDPVIIPAAIGVLLWVALYLRDRRLWRLVPFRLRQDVD